MRIRRIASVITLSVLPVLGAACTSNGTTSQPTTTAGGGTTTTIDPNIPGANVDPNSHNFITGPINTARGTVNQLNNDLNNEANQAGQIANGG